VAGKAFSAQLFAEQLALLKSTPRCTGMAVPAPEPVGR